MVDSENSESKKYRRNSHQRKKQYGRDNDGSTLSVGSQSYAGSSPPSAHRSVVDAPSAKGSVPSRGANSKRGQAHTNGAPGSAASGSAGVQVELPNRPTAFEVWNAKHQATKPPLPKPPKVLTEDELTGLVEHLYSTWKTSESKLQQAREEAQRLEVEACKPQCPPAASAINAKLAGHLEPMLQRTLQDQVEREARLQRQRKLKSEAELKECTFAPEIKNRMSPKQRSREDLEEFAREKEERRLQRKHAIEVLESRELLFSPQLNQTSVKIQERMKREGKIVKDKQTGISFVAESTRSKQAEPRVSDFDFTPQLNPKNASYAPANPDVYNRLFSHAAAKSQNTSNQQALRQGSTPQEVQEADMPQEQVSTGCNRRGLYLPTQHYVLESEDKEEPMLYLSDAPTSSEDGSEDYCPINVLEYTDDYEFLIKKLHVWQYAN